MAAHDVLVRVVMELSATRELRDIMTIVRTAARELASADGATFVLREGDLCHYADEDAIGPLWKGQRFPADACISGWAMKHGQPAVVEDIEQDPRIPLATYRDTFVRSLVMLPIRPADPIGAIGAYWARPHRATGEAVQLLQALADSTAIALENVRALDEARRWRALLSEAGDIVWTLDSRTRTGELQGVARWWTAITGRPAQAPINPERWLCDVIPEDRPPLAQAWRASLEAPAPFRARFRIRAQDGGTRHLVARAAAVPRADGSHELVGMMSDVTREREAEAAVQSLLDRERVAREHAESARRTMDQTLDRVSDGFVAIDREWRYTYVNDPACQMLGRQREQLIGAHVWTAFPEAQDGPSHRALQRALASQQATFEEHYFPPWRRWFENRIYPSATGLSVFFTDVSERRAAAEALEEARLRLAMAMQASNVGLWEWNPQLREWHSTQECARQLGYEPHECADTIEFWQDRVHPDDRDAWRKSVGIAEHAPLQPFHEEMRLRHRDGSYRWVLWRAAAVEGGSRSAARIRGCQVDITELKRVQDDRERLHRAVETEKRLLKRLAECVPVGIVMVEAPSGRLIFSNQHAADILGDSLAHTEVGARGPCGDAANAELDPLALIGRVLRTGEALLDREAVAAGSPASRGTLLVSAVPVNDADGRLEAVVASMHDVTESRAVRETLRQLSRRLLTAQDEERRRISRDLHDDLAQVLTAVKMSLATLVEGSSPHGLETSVRNAMEIVDRSIRQARDLSLRLHPPMLDVLGLGATLRWYLGERWGGGPPVPKVSIAFESSRRFPAPVENACFRVLQEALTNVLRHAAARHVWIDVREEAGSLVMMVKDDGRGFELRTTGAGAASGESAGLAGMQERVALAGGLLELASQPGTGTRVCARFPLQDP